jgi:hypothetical protein
MNVLIIKSFCSPGRELNVDCDQVILTEVTPVFLAIFAAKFLLITRPVALTTLWRSIGFSSLFNTTLTYFNLLLGSRLLDLFKQHLIFLWINFRLSFVPFFGWVKNFCWTMFQEPTLTININIFFLKALRPNLNF